MGKRRMRRRGPLLRVLLPPLGKTGTRVDVVVIRSLALIDAFPYFANDAPMCQAGLHAVAYPHLARIAQYFSGREAADNGIAPPQCGEGIDGIECSAEPRQLPPLIL